MPGMTPTGIVYPCASDTIDCTVFQTNADSIQAALDSTQAVVDSVLTPAAVALRTSPTQNVAAGVSTVMTYGAIMYDTAAMFNIGTPTIITIQSSGTYLVNCRSERFSAPGTQTSTRIAILLNGVEWSHHKVDVGTGTTLEASPLFVSAMLPSLVVGDQITTTHLYTGTTNMNIQHHVAVTKISIV